MVKNPKVKEEDPEFDSEEESQAKKDRKAIERANIEAKRKADVQKFVEERKNANTAVTQPMILEDLVMVPASPNNILQYIKDWEGKGYRLYSNIFYISQIYLIFKKLPAKPTA
jgi:hypothetical protein